ncbi:hypothetical protein ACFLUJ_05225 [Chloroflexota bacterium]
MIVKKGLFFFLKDMPTDGPTHQYEKPLSLPPVTVYASVSLLSRPPLMPGISKRHTYTHQYAYAFV